jgi:putative component of membrane protein insertase Oxa1/YidC/SpoIIIJ protein YidD
MKLGRALLLAAIRAYKRHVSPHKGFACAWRVHAGGCSCSTLGLRAISRYGAWRGLGVLRLRLRQCRLVAEQARARPFVARAAQAGFVDCDVPCDASCTDGAACSGGEACSIGDACEIGSCLPCGDVDDCGWPWGRSASGPARRRRRRGDPVRGTSGDEPAAEPPPAG